MKFLEFSLFPFRLIFRLSYKGSLPVETVHITIKLFWKLKKLILYSYIFLGFALCCVLFRARICAVETGMDLELDFNSKSTFGTLLYLLPIYKYCSYWSNIKKQMGYHHRHVISHVTFDAIGDVIIIILPNAWAVVRDP